MAKSKSFFGLRSGSTKSLTFQVYRGEQITKDRVHRVSNPRTEAQMTQRALIPIVAAARSALKGLVDHSFEGVAYGEASLREFSKKNLRGGALTVTSYSPNGVSNPGFADFIISHGSINEDYDAIPRGDAAIVRTVEDQLPLFSLPAAKANDPAEPLLDYVAKWATDNKVTLIKPGSQLSFLSMIETGAVKVNTGNGYRMAPTSSFFLNRCYIPKGEDDSPEALAINDEWKVMEDVTEGGNMFTLKNEKGDQITFKCGNNDAQTQKAMLQIFVTPAYIYEYDNHHLCGAALILSRFENGVWKRNSSRLNFNKELIETGVYTFANWLTTYKMTGSASKKWLNNGDESTGIQG